MRKFVLVVLAAAVLVSFAAPAFAAFDNFKTSPWTKETTYIDKSINKLGFGLTNLTIGWTAIPYEMHKNSNLYTGFFKGIWRTVTNTVGGVLHTATFPIPLDIPLPDGGVNFE